MIATVQDHFFPGNGHADHQGGGRILIVDADESHRRQTAATLRQQGYAAVEAASAGRALEVLGARLVQAAVADADLVDQSGIDLLAESARCHPAVPMVLHTTSYNVDRAVHMTARRGACDYFNRPFTPRRLLTGITAALEKYEKNVADLERQRRLQKYQLCARLQCELLNEHVNPLTAIQGHADLVRTWYESDPQLEQLETIFSYSEWLAESNRQVLHFGRFEPRRPRELDVHVLLMRMKRLLKRVFGRFVHIVTESGTGLGLVYADENELEQVILTLAVNAVDAMPLGGWLCLRAAHDEFAEPIGSVPPGSYIVLSVRDTGHGMEASTRARMFEPFFTTHKTPAAIGLGLSVVEDIVAGAGGAVTVSTAPGRGADFAVYLPRLLAASAAVDPMVMVRARNRSEREVGPC